MKGVEDGEYVVRGHAQSSITEETETPGESQQTAETHDGGYVGRAGLRAFQFPSFLPKYADPSQDHNEGAEREDEDEAVITDVYRIMHSGVYNPAPAGSTAGICETVNVSASILKL